MIKGMNMKVRMSLSGGVATALIVSIAGCSQPALKKTEIRSPYDRPVVLAVAPTLNYSGSSDFDTLQVADLFASELGSVQGIQVIGVNRVVAVLTQDGQKSIVSPAHAMEICRTIGCDGIIVFAVTEYDAFTPVVGLAVQLYMLSPQKLMDRFDPVAASREAAPFKAEASPAGGLAPSAQIQRVFNAAHNDVSHAVERYAKQRDSEERAFGWRRYLKSQRLYVRFCCWSAIHEMMGQERHRQLAEAVDKEE